MSEHTDANYTIRSETKQLKAAMIGQGFDYLETKTIPTAGKTTIIDNALRFKYQNTWFEVSLDENGITIEKPYMVKKVWYQKKISVLCYPVSADTIRQLKDQLKPHIDSSIILTKEGDTLQIHNGIGEWEKIATYTPFTHQICSGNLSLRITTKTHQTLSCDRCNLRIAFPKNIETFTDLIKHLKEQNIKQPALNSLGMAIDFK